LVERDTTDGQRNAKQSIERRRVVLVEVVSKDDNRVSVVLRNANWWEICKE